MAAMSRGEIALDGDTAVVDNAAMVTHHSRASRESSSATWSGENAGGLDEAPVTRQALVRYAVDGLQRFKQSWKSVMLLKAGVGLGQVIVLVVLLILANYIPSPSYPSQSQVVPSDACPHPRLFQAWMGVQIARLTICWSVSCWICIRTEKARERRRAERALEQADGDEQAAGSGGNESRRGRPEPSLTLAADARHPARASRQSFPPQGAPSLVHSTSSNSTVTLATMAMSGSSPSTPHTSHFASSSRLDLSCVPELQSDCLPVHEEHEMARKPMRSPPAHLDVRNSEDEELGGGLQVPHRRLAERPSMRSLRDARSMHRGEAPTHPGGSETTAPGLAGWLDKHALSISRTLGFISLILFFLGNILLFYPPPSSSSCYSANPLLWWGVCTVTAVGWVLLLQVFFVVVIVGLGGAVVVNALRRLGVIPAPIEPEPPRTAQPDPLSREELSLIKIVCYVPAEDSGDSEKSATAFCSTRLPFPPVYLPPHQSSCAICQESFSPPTEGRTILLKADKLRQLRCDHVYHMDCIDQWLLRGSGNCPACNAPVRAEDASNRSHARTNSGGMSLLSPGRNRGSSRSPTEVV